MNRPELRQTADGSMTLFQPQVGDTYHSIHGAIRESMHVFIELGLSRFSGYQGELSILELGFGTGLNCLLSLRYAASTGLRFRYHGIEIMPIDAGLLEDLAASYPEPEWFRDIHDAGWGGWTEIGRGCRLLKSECDIRSFDPIGAPYDLVYFDAFSPDLQPELWSDKVFRHIASHGHPGTVLVTYSCKGDVRRAMKAAGFSVAKHPGPPGKREVLSAVLKG